MRRKLVLESLETRNLLTSFSGSLLKDITPGAESSQLSNFSGSESKLLFNVGVSDLWITDGTTEGTKFLADNIQPLSVEPLDSRGHILFAGKSGTGGGFWYSDGTTIGTRSFDQPAAGIETVSIAFESEAFDIIQFRDPGRTSDLDTNYYWRFDGLSVPQELGECSELVGQGNVAALKCGTRLVVLNGAADPVVMHEAVDSSVQVSDGQIYFMATDASEELGLYRTDGTTPAIEPLIKFEADFAARDFRVLGEQMLYLERSFPRNDLWSMNWNTGEVLKLSTVFASTRPFSSIEWFGRINDVHLFGDFRSSFSTDGTVEGTKWLIGPYLGELDGQHIVAANDTVLTTDGTNLFDLQGRPYKPATPGLPGPPVFYTYAIDGNSIIRFFHNSFYGTVYSVWNGSSYREFADSTAGGRRNVGSTSFANVGSEWYGIDDVNQFCEKSRLLRSSSSSTVLFAKNRGCTGPMGAPTPVQDISFFAREGRLDDSPLFVDVGDSGELWAVDGDGPMELISDEKPDVSSGLMYGKNGTFLLVQDETDEVEETLKLLATNGTSEATVEVAIDAAPIAIVPWKETTLVIADSPEHGQEIWRIDGSYDQTPYEGLEVEIGSFTVDEGDTLSLQVDVVGNGNGADLSFDWDITNDGEIDETTSEPALSLGWEAWQNIEFETKDVYIPFSVHIRSATESIVDSGLLTINNVPPTRGSDNPISIQADGDRPFRDKPLSITYDATDIGQITYRFDLGDGTAIEQESPTVAHTYTAAGQYTIFVSATDAFNQRISDTLDVSVELENSADAWIFDASVVFGGNELTTDVDMIGPDRFVTPVTRDSNQTWRIYRNSDRPQQIDSIRTNSSFSSPDSNSIYSAVGDINNDGVVQALVATQGEGLEGWQIGDPTTLSYDVALGDLDGDGDLDVFAANYQNADFSPAADWVFINNGDGSLRSGAGFTWTDQRLGAYQSRSVELGDVDGDGDLDAVTAALWPDTNHLWLNDGNGKFTESKQPLGAGSEHVALGDLDVDDDLDLFIAVGGANQVWLNDGNGQFADSGQRLGAANSSHVVLGDLDLDGDLDAFVANWEGDANTAWVNDGSGRFSDSGLRLAPSKSTEHIAVSDLDNDGDLDVLAASWGSPNHLYLNNTIIADVIAPTLTRAVAGTDSLFMQFSEPIENLAAITIPSVSSIEAADLVWTESRDGFTWSGVDVTAGDSFVLFIRTDNNSPVTDLSGNTMDSFGPQNDGFNLFAGHKFRIRTTFEGDLDGDLDVDFADFLALSANFGQTNAAPDDGDIDGDGSVSFADFLLLSANFGKSAQRR